LLDKLEIAPGVESCPASFSLCVIASLREIFTASGWRLVALPPVVGVRAEKLEPVVGFGQCYPTWQPSGSLTE